MVRSTPFLLASGGEMVHAAGDWRHTDHSAACWGSGDPADVEAAVETGPELNV
jgi:hypothetical protein